MTSFLTWPPREGEKLRNRLEGALGRRALKGGSTMSAKDKHLLDDLKSSVPKEGDTLEVELPDQDLDAVSGGLEPVQGDNCLCMCGSGGGCSGSGSG
jgi:hypothetical protein